MPIRREVAAVEIFILPLVVLVELVWCGSAFGPVGPACSGGCFGKRPPNTTPRRTAWELALLPSFRQGRRQERQRNSSFERIRVAWPGCWTAILRDASSPSSSAQEPARSDCKDAQTPRVFTCSGGVSSYGGAAAGGGGEHKKNRQDMKRGEQEQANDYILLENYASRHSEPESPCLAGVREVTNRAQPGGAHMISGHLQGGLLKLLAKISGAKRVLDIGTFTGYSALAFAEALPEDGVVVTLESDARAVETARGHFASSEHGGKIRLLQGQAMDGIDQLIKDQGCPQFDIIFVDADKKRYWDYFEKVLSGPRPLLAPTGMLLADNVLFHELVPLAEAKGAAATGSSGNKAQQLDGRVDLPPERAFREISPGDGQGAAAVGAGVLAPTPRRMRIAESLDRFNKRVKEDSRVEVLMLPLRDGLSVVTWRSGDRKIPRG